MGGVQMNEEEVIQLLRHYRHDWMNELQLIMGYAQMGNIEKVQEKVNQAVEHAALDRKLQSIPLPKTALWIMQFNWEFANFRMTHDVKVNQTITVDDQTVVDQLKQLMTYLVEHSLKMSLYHVTLVLRETDQHQLEILLRLDGEIENERTLIEKLKTMNPSMQVNSKTNQQENHDLDLTWLVK